MVFASKASGTRPLEIVQEDCPPDYIKTYVANKWELLDPVLSHSRVAKLPFLWRDLVDPRGLTSRQKVFFAECREFGVHDGLTMPFHAPDATTYLMSVSRRNGPAPDVTRIPFIYALAAQTWIRHCALAVGDRPSDPALLTPREKECLVWAKEGKTNWEISRILGVAERTIEFHIGNVIRKLSASNRITAIVMAIQDGLLEL